MFNRNARVMHILIFALVGVVSELLGLAITEAFIPPNLRVHHVSTPQSPSSARRFANTHSPAIRWKDTSVHVNYHIDDDGSIEISSRKDIGDAPETSLEGYLTSLFQAAGTNIKLLSAVATLLVFSASTHVPHANAVLGAGGAVVSSPGIVKAITLDDFLKLPEKKQRQYEGGFLSCSYDSITVPQLSVEGLKPGLKQKKVRSPKKICRPTNVIDELLKEVDLMAESDPERAEEYSAAANNILQRQRLVNRRTVEAALGKQPSVVYFGCAFLASCVATSIMHPIDTLKVRLISGKGDADEDEKEEVPLLKSLISLYDGLLPNLVKEGPASALYLGIYEYSRTLLEQVPFLQGNVLLIYLLAGSIGELAGSIVRSPAEAVKTRVQAGIYNVPDAVENVFFTPEGRKNTFLAWSAGVFRDVPHGAVLIATFEVTKTLIVDSPIDIDVNTLLSEALLGGLGGGLGAFISTPSDVVTTKIITSIEDGGEPPLPQDTLAEVWNEGGLSGIFAGVTERVGYWTLSYGIFLSVYCSLRQYALVVLK